MDKKSFRLLINADNLSPRYLEVVLAEASKYGELVDKRIYGDWVGADKRPWKELLVRNSFVPVQVGGTESAIMMDALDIIGVDEVEGLILAAYDSDFSRVVLKLKAAGKTVIGMGDKMTPSAYIKACEKFVFFDVVSMSDMPGRAVSTGSTVGFQRKEADGSVVVDGSVATDETEVPEKEEMEKREVTVVLQETDEKAVEEALTVSVKDVEKYTLEILEKEEYAGKILAESLALMLKQKFPMFSHKKFGYSKFPQFIESIKCFGIVTVASKYDLTQTKMYVVSREYAEEVMRQTGETDAEGHPLLAENAPELSLEEIEKAIIEIIEKEGCNGVISLGALRYSLKGKYPEFDQKAYGRTKFNKFMELIQGVRLEMEEMEDGQAPRMVVIKK